MRLRDRLRDLTRRIVDLATQEEDPERALAVTLSLVGQTLEWPLGLAYRVEPSPEAARLVLASHYCAEEGDRYRSFLQASEPGLFAPGEDLPGQVCSRCEAVWLSDLIHAPESPRRESGRVAGLRTGAGFPVLVGAEVVAVLEFLTSERVEPDARVLDVLTHLGVQLGRVYERERVRRQLEDRERQYRTDVSDLRRSETELRTILETEPACLKLIATDGTVLRSNRAGLEMLDAEDAADVLGRCVFDLIATEHRVRVREILNAVFRGETRAFNVDVITLKGRRLTLETHAAPFPEPDGTISRVLTVTRDVTEARELEEQFRQAQKMEAVGRLAGGVAHDFNNMLGVITGYSEMLLSSLPEESPLRGPLREISRAGERAANLTRQLLAFSRKQVLDPRVVDLREIVGDLQRMLGRLIGEDIRLRTELDTLPTYVHVDPTQVEQLLLNLAVNSRDAMPHGGTLSLGVRNVEWTESPARGFSDLEPGRYVRLSVTDTGCGMDVETREHIFEPFFTTKPAGLGTGLGLATVFGIVQQAGGHIHVESEPGVGTTFDIFLPRAAGVPENRDVKAPTPAGGTETVLLVEDEDLVRRLVHSVLESYGYQVLLARDGDEALRIAGEYAGTIHLLLTDVVMPGSLNGRALAEKLTEWLPDLSVLYMSGYTDDAVVRGGVEGPSTHFIQKPFTPDELAAKVRAVLDAGPWRARPCRILIVDDDPAARESLAEVLEAEGYQVTTASGGRQGLEYLRQGHRPDLILLDLVMPGMNGWVFRAEQERDPALADIPVVIVSGAQDPAPAAGYLRTALSLAKPLDVPRLLAEIERCCGRR